MGGSSGYRSGCNREHVGTHKRTDDVFDELTFHNNFRFPRAPKVLTPTNVANFVIESMARFLSPSPKIEGEDNEFRCDDLAATLRADFKDEILAQLRRAYQKQARDYEKLTKRIHREMMKGADI